MLNCNNKQPDVELKKNAQPVQVEHKLEAPVLSDITTTIIKTRNNHKTCNKETFSNSNQKLRNKTIVNLPKQILSIDETSVLELGLTFCPTVKMLSKEKTTNDLYRFIRQLKSHQYFL